jgi:segregation and condensation protein B
VPHKEALSPAALQVLAIVAYEQPVTRADIARIRGVDSDGVVASLLARGLVAEDRRRAVRGGLLPLITTANFLRQLGLASLTELPPLRAVAQPLSVAREQVAVRTPIDQGGHSRSRSLTGSVPTQPAEPE